MQIAAGFAPSTFFGPRTSALLKEPHFSTWLNKLRLLPEQTYAAPSGAYPPPVAEISETGTGNGSKTDKYYANLAACPHDAVIYLIRRLFPQRFTLFRAFPSQVAWQQTSCSLQDPPPSSCPTFQQRKTATQLRRKRRNRGAKEGGGMQMIEP